MNTEGDPYEHQRNRSRDPEAHLVLAPPRSTDTLYRAVTAGDFVRERDVVLRRLQRMGVLVVDGGLTIRNA
jgi:hypothetical protein